MFWTIVGAILFVMALPTIIEIFVEIVTSKLFWQIIGVIILAILGIAFFSMINENKERGEAITIMLAGVAILVWTYYYNRRAKVFKKIIK